MWYANLRKNTRLGTLLVKRGAISTAQLHAAVNIQRERPRANLGDILVEQGWVSHRDIRRGLRRQARIRYVAALLAMLCAPLQTVSAGSIPTASANAERVAITDAQAYADCPQLKLHDAGERSGRVSTSLSRGVRLATRMMIRSAWQSYRANADESDTRTSRQTFSPNYSLRLSDDEVLVRAKFNF